MSQEQKQMTLQEFVSTLRNNIILSLDGGKEQALKSFDVITQKLVEQIQINQKLQEKIDKLSVETDKKSKK